MTRRESPPPTGMDAPKSARPRWLPLLPALAAIAVYANSWNVPFNFDDYESIVDNASIRSLRDLSTVLQPPPQISVAGRPLLNLSLALNYAVSRLDVRSYHAVNVAIHVLAVLALFGVIRRVLRTHRLSNRFGRAADWIAVIVAGLWAVHPLQTMCVTYVVQRAESMVSLAYLLTLYCFLRGAETNAKPWLLLSILCCAAGMGCKEVMVTAPMMVLLCDRTLIAESFIDALRRRGLYYLGLAATWSWLAWLNLSGPRSASAGFGLEEVNAWQYLRTQPEVILHYLSLVFWPHPLLLDYEWPISHSLWKIIPAAAVILILMGWTIRNIIRRSAAGLPWAGFFFILAPTSSFVPIIILASEHRMYLALAAVLTTVCVVVYSWLRPRLVTGGTFVRFAVGFVVVALATACGYLTIERNREYQNLVTVWANNVNHRPENPRARLCLGWALFRQGDMAGAIEQYRHALALSPNYVDAMVNLGETLLRTGQRAEAARTFRQAMATRPRTLAAQVGLANVLVGEARHDEAATLYRKALEIQPNYAPAMVGYGLLLASKGKISEAAALYRRAIEAKPDDPSLHYLLGLVLAADSQFDEAITQFSEVISLQPSHVAARYRLALCLYSAGRIQESLVQYRTVLQTEPKNAQAQANYAIALQRLGDAAAAANAYRHAIIADPNMHEARQSLAWMLATHPDDRIRNGEEAVRVAESLDQATQHGNFASLDTLAAAYAEAGRFPDAVQTATKAIELAREAGDNKAMTQIEARQLQYRQGEPFRAGHTHSSESGEWKPESQPAGRMTTP